MIYLLNYIGGPDDGSEVMSPRPYSHTRDERGHVYAIIGAEEDCQEWVGDDQRRITLHYCGICHCDDWVEMTPREVA